MYRLWDETVGCEGGVLGVGGMGCLGFWAWKVFCFEGVA